MIEHPIDGWPGFIEFVDALDIAPPTFLAYLYRGHANKDWKLQPTLLRDLVRLELNEKESLDLEFAGTESFVSQAAIHLQPHVFLSAKTHLDWWSLMQHYGAPTRLLDWTESIYVAAYFAVTSHLDVDGAIWVLHPASIKEKMIKKFGENQDGIENGDFLGLNLPYNLIFKHREIKTERMIAQQGGYGICQNILGDHEKIIEDALGDERKKLIFDKIIIPKEEKPEFIKKLRMMNITGSSLFPGLDGVGKSISEMVSLGIREL